jgi:hypothetical protein
MSTQKTRLLLETLFVLLEKKAEMSLNVGVRIQCQENLRRISFIQRLRTTGVRNGLWRMVEATGGQRKLSFEEIHTGSMRSVGNVARTGKKLNGNKIFVCQLNAKKGHRSFNDKGILFPNRTF